ncbi:MAG: hypothetical protein GW917_01760 [Bdellovibrionales bacterium]|nr:hypothetical protein [Bdellovibrionales bacterium]
MFERERFAEEGVVNAASIVPKFTCETEVFYFRDNFGHLNASGEHEKLSERGLAAIYDVRSTTCFGDEPSEKSRVIAIDIKVIIEFWAARHSASIGRLDSKKACK